MKQFELTVWLKSLGLEEYSIAFRENAVDADILPELTVEDLKDLGVVQVGHRRKLLSAIADMQRSPSSPEQSAEASEDGPAPPAASVADVTLSEPERRQLTVMFCDIVGSTRLATELDPEDYRDIINVYHRTVAETVERFDGFVAKYMGDGVLAYFGYPQAHEDDAEKALRAGLSLIEAVSHLPAPGGLKVRIGVDTGLVVVGDLAGVGGAQERAVAGETPNLAARLQDMSEPNSVLISSRTRRLVGNLFDFASLGKREVKGFSDAIEVWSVLGLSNTESRFEALHATGLSPLVGREEEIGLLLKRWEEAKESDGQTVLLTGEPGIGKSRIVRAMTERLSGESCVRLRYHCSPSFANTAFHPFIGQLQRASGSDHNDPTERQLDCLEALLGRAVDDVQDVAPLFASLLSIPPGDRYPPLSVSPQRQKELTLAALLEQLEGLAAKYPVLVVFEDVHWIDPSSKELLEMMVDRLRSWRVLLVATCRPEFVAPSGSAAHVTTLSLNRLGRRQGIALIQKVAGGKDLPEEVVDQILEKTDGVPLFIEEFTKTVIEGGFLQEQRDRYLLSGPLPQLAIPATLHDSLMARLDRLAPVKEVAQIGAVIGREFSHELLSACSPLPDQKLREALDQLVGAELIFQRGAPPKATYIFKHALVQDAAYASLLRNKRRELHAQITKAIQERTPATALDSPEVLAHHCTEAGLVEEAIGYWQQAGKRAAEHSAGEEAAAHLTKALELTGQLPDANERAEQELALQLTLAPVLMLVEGFGSPKVRAAYTRARDLCRQSGDPTQLFMVTFGLWHVHQNRGDLECARGLADEVLALARERSDPAFLLQAHHAAWTTLFHLAEQATCFEHTAEGRMLYDAEIHRKHKFTFGGHDPGVCACNHGALTSWLLGYPDQAITLSQEAVALAEQSDHAMSLVLAHCFASFLHQFRSEPEAALERAEAVVAICTDQGIAPHYVATGRIMRGWAKAVLHDPEAGAGEIREGLADLASTEMNARRPHYLAMLAEVETLAGRPEKGLDALSQAKELIESTGERRWEADVYRLEGELQEALASDADPEASFKKALDVASSQQVKSLELRAAISLARRWQKTGRKKDASDILVPIYGWFTEGHETADLRQAKTLLDELA